MTGKVNHEKIMKYIREADTTSSVSGSDNSQLSVITKLYYDSWQKLMRDRQSGKFNNDVDIPCAEHYAYARWFVYKDGYSSRQANASQLSASIAAYAVAKSVLDLTGKIMNFGEEPDWSPRQMLKLLSGLGSQNKGSVSEFSFDQIDWQYKGLNAGLNAPQTPTELAEEEEEEVE